MERKHSVYCFIGFLTQKGNLCRFVIIQMQMLHSVFLSLFNRYCDMMKFFPRGRSALSEIFNYMVDYVSDEKGHLLKSFNQTFLSREQIELFCESISSKGSPYKRCFGFIDGTIRAVCRPCKDQREVRDQTAKRNPCTSIKNCDFIFAVLQWA